MPNFISSLPDAYVPSRAYPHSRKCERTCQDAKMHIESLAQCWSTSRTGDRLGSEGSAQSAAHVRQEQIDAAGVRDEVVVHRARAFLLGFAHEPLEVREESVDGAAEIHVPAV